MAIYHLSMKTVSRGHGSTAVGAGAYRAGEKATDAKTGKVFDFSSKDHVVHSEVLLPEGAPGWMADRQALWNAVEAVEDRSTRPDNAQLAREVELALPRELSQEERIALVKDFAQREFVARGMVVDLNIHEPLSAIDGVVQPHAHILLTLREVAAEGFGNKERSWNDRGLLQSWREHWAADVNQALADAGIDARVDHRSLREQGIEREPQPKIGAAAQGMERRGLASERGERWREVQERNAERAAGHVAEAETSATQQAADNGAAMGT